jgi:hypothetical protein
MSSMLLYLLQTLLLGLVLLRLTSSGTTALRMHIVAWILLTSAIFLRYGSVEQLIFYSSDQKYHVYLVQRILDGSDWRNFSWWFLDTRAPYTVPAAMLNLVGIDTALALKTVSLGYFLGTVSFMRTIVTSVGLKPRISTLFMTATGPIGVLFASLALRETAMMFFVLYAIRGASPIHRILALCMLGLLRPHLAAALFLGMVIVELFGNLRKTDSSWHPMIAFSSLVSGTLLGSLLFAIGANLLYGNQLSLRQSFGIQPTVRIASNFVGLQFLAAPDGTVALSIADLLLARLLLTETIVIPLLFTFVVLTSRGVDRYSQLALWSFSIYVGLATKTDNNSFRQNLPLMPTMGLTVLQMLQNRHQPKLYSKLVRMRVGTSD